MADDPTTKPEGGTIMCSACQQMFEIPDPLALLRALHLAHYCDETQGLTHG